jgi:hypothetical protein
MPLTCKESVTDKGLSYWIEIVPPGGGSGGGGGGGESPPQAASSITGASRASVSNSDFLMFILHRVGIESSRRFTVKRLAISIQISLFRYGVSAKAEPQVAN